MENLEILIIEDNLSFALELEITLAKWGCKNVKTVNNSVDAFNVLDSFMTDIILMDINLQGELNGIQIAERIQNTGIPIIYMTGQKSEKLYESAKKTNLSSYLVKPFDNLTLKSAIETGVKSKPFKEKVAVDEKINSFYIRKGKSIKKILTDDIDFIVSDANYCDLYHNDVKSTIKSSLKRIFEQLPEQEFLRVHNQYIVRVSKIDEIFLSKGEIMIDNNVIPIGRSYKKKLKERLKML